MEVQVGLVVKRQLQGTDCCAVLLQYCGSVQVRKLLKDMKKHTMYRNACWVSCLQVQTVVLPHINRELLQYCGSA